MTEAAEGPNPIPPRGQREELLGVGPSEPRRAKRDHLSGIYPAFSCSPSHTRAPTFFRRWFSALDSVALKQQRPECIDSIEGVGEREAFVFVDQNVRLAAVTR
jgi:hypothetical protein